MSEELQSLLDKIRHEGVEKAKSEAEAILADARREADAVKAAAETEAAKTIASAKADAKAFEARAEATVRQAMRDVKLQLAAELEKQVEAFVSAGVKKAFASGDNVGAWITKAVDAYLAQGEKGMAIALGGDCAKMAESVMAALAAKASSGGIEVEASPAFPDGFTIKLDGGRVEQCFTADAVAAALSRLMRPGLADLLKDSR